ncbi:hypothetical protein B0H34DRAFT_802939 [Crassisporium funariophilum]|nr:hypothetical protein B0H34DRAFT_802939 [Crassisporium funariophilum]
MTIGALEHGDTATNAHDLSSSSSSSTSQPRRRGSRPPRSPSSTRSSASTAPPRSSTSTTTTKRSPSPIITFHPAPLSAENAKGVKNITRKVIKRLEGLGHLEMVDLVDLGEEEESGGSSGDGVRSGGEEEQEVEKVLYAMGREAVKKAQVTNGNGNGNGHGHAHVEKVKKATPDLEIPRKVLHGSIGFFTLYLYISEGDVRTIVLVLWMALAIIIPADLLRFKSQRFERLYERYLGFLMRESEKDSINGVVWYILGVNFVLSLYPQDIATVAILILSWADTAASTIGRLYGSQTRKLPARLPLLRLPLAPRKSLAGFSAATVTGAAIALGFWTWVAPLRAGGRDVSWAWEGGVRAAVGSGVGEGREGLGAGGAIGLLAIGLVAGVVSGVAEALDLGSVDDNLTLPIISGGCILGFMKLLGLGAAAYSGSSWFS